jgi:hypothetical protein
MVTPMGTPAPALEAFRAWPFAPRRLEKLTLLPRMLPKAQLSQIGPSSGGLLQTILNLQTTDFRDYD